MTPPFDSDRSPVADSPDSPEGRGPSPADPGDRPRNGNGAPRKAPEGKPDDPARDRRSKTVAEDLDDLAHFVMHGSGRWPEGESAANGKAVREADAESSKSEPEFEPEFETKSETPEGEPAEPRTLETGTSDLERAEARSSATKTSSTETSDSQKTTKFQKDFQKANFQKESLQQEDLRQEDLRQEDLQQESLRQDNSQKASPQESEIQEGEIPAPIARESASQAPDSESPEVASREGEAREVEAREVEARELETSGAIAPNVEPPKVNPPNVKPPDSVKSPGSKPSDSKSPDSVKPSDSKPSDSVKSPDSKPSDSKPSELEPSESGAGGSETATETSVDASAETSSEEAAEEMATGFWPVLQNRNFLALWSGQVFSQLADKVYLVMAIALVAAHFQRPGEPISGWVSAITIAFTIPAVLFGSLAGVYVDRHPKKTVLVLTNLLRGLLVLALPALLWLSQDWSPLSGWAGLGKAVPAGFALLLLVTFGVSALTQFFAPAEQAVIPLIVRRQHLLSANSLYTTTMMAAAIVGFAVGEPLLGLANRWGERLGGGGDLGQEVAVGLAYAIAGLVLLAVRSREARPDPDAEPPHLLADLRVGVRYLAQRPLVRNALIQLVILFSIFAALTVLAVRLAELIPTLKSSQFGILLSAGGLGMGMGAAVLGQFGSYLPYGQLALWGSLGMGGSLAALSFCTETLWGAIACIAVLGATAALVGIPMQTVIQQETPEAMRGKVFGLQNNAVNVALSLPLALAGVAESRLGLPPVLWILAALAAIGGLATWYISVAGRAPKARRDSR